MAKLVVLITARVDEVHNIGEAWQKAGAPGATVIESYGIRRLQEASKSGEILTGAISFLEILRENEQTNVLLLSLVDDDTLVEKLLAATEAILGDLKLPDNGIFFVVNIERAVGIQDHRQT